jgi:hypothetical protein
MGGRPRLCAVIAPQLALERLDAPLVALGLLPAGARLFRLGQRSRGRRCSSADSVDATTVLTWGGGRLLAAHASRGAGRKRIGQMAYGPVFQRTLRAAEQHRFMCSTSMRR